MFDWISYRGKYKHNLHKTKTTLYIYYTLITHRFDVHSSARTFTNDFIFLSEPAQVLLFQNELSFCFPKLSLVVSTTIHTSYYVGTYGLLYFPVPPSSNVTSAFRFITGRTPLELLTLL